MFLQNDSQSNVTKKDELLSVLSNQYCRFVVRFFRDAPEDDASVEELSAAFAREYGGGKDQAAIRLHHTALPKLHDAGVAEYDTRSRAVRYRGHPELETLLGNIDSESECALEVE